MITIEHDRDNYLVCRVSGRLTEADYEAAVPEIENALVLRDEPLRLMIVLEDFRGWDIAALWEDLKFDVRHGGDFGRIAVLGESKLEEWGAALSKPFLGSEIRYFDINERPAARAWLSEGRSPQPAT
ncbi:MAG TPA: STAS/SEC14 domain-containing protein [Kiloniellaceae bacterium]